MDMPGIDPLANVLEMASRRAPQTVAEVRAEAGGKPVIRITAGALDTITTEIEDLIVQSGLPLFQRGLHLVRPVLREVKASHGRTTLVGGLAVLKTAGLIDIFSQAAEWQRFDGRSKGYVRKDPPKGVAEILLERHGRWRVPVVAGVVTVPTLRRDGTVLSEPGYDRETRLYHFTDSTVVLHADVHVPTRAAAEAALAELRALLVEFPFVNEASRSVALSGMISPVVRGALPAVPLHGYRATTAGTGKSYLSDIDSAILTGRPCPVTSAAPNDDAENEKRLGGLLLAGFPLINLDNCNAELGGDLLCQAVDRPLVQIRKLGGSDIMEVESVASILATGNNMRLRGDLTRRSVIADMDAGVERPELREFRDDPVARVLQDRGKYVSACLVIVRAYMKAGLPGRLKPIAGFQEWSDLVRSALVWLGSADPAETMEAARDDDPVLTQLREVMVAWDEALGDDPCTTKRLLEKARETRPEFDENGDAPVYGGKHLPRYPELDEALRHLAGRGRNREIDALALSVWLRSAAGRVTAINGRLRRFKRSNEGATSAAGRWALQQQIDGRWP